MMSSPHDTIKDTQEENRKLRNTNRVFIGIFVILSVLIWIQQNDIHQYKKDIVMMGKDIAARQHQLYKWEEFNRTHIPETALPRIKEIEAFYLKG